MKKMGCRDAEFRYYTARKNLIFTFNIHTKKEILMIDFSVLRNDRDHLTDTDCKYELYV